MKKQTYIIVLEDQDGRTVDFERWTYKRAQTCIDKIVELYAEWPGLYGKNLERAARIVCYPTPDGYNQAAPVWNVSVNEFRRMIEAKKEKNREKIRRLEELEKGPAWPLAKARRAERTPEPATEPGQPILP